MSSLKALAAWLFLGVACVSAQPVLAPVAGDEVTLFVHGYKGALLATAEGELAWLTPGQAFSHGEKSLALPFEGQRESPPRYGPLTVVGPITRLTILPLAIEQTLYLPFMEWGRDHLPGFMVFAYDWRQDIRSTASQLCARIEALGPNRKVNIIAHSMGGLVTLDCLRHGAPAARERVKRVVFVGTPFKGSVGSWDDLFLGNTTARNTALMPASALLTFSSTWELLPPQPDFFVDEHGAPREVDAFSSASWVDQGWGVFADPSLKGNAAYLNQLDARLTARREFWAGMGDETAAAPLWQSLAIVGTGRQTEASWVMKADGRFDFEHPGHADGDGTVVTSRATPPAPVRAVSVETGAEHAVMLNDAAVQKAIAEFITR